jgi:fructokinase
MYGAIEAGGTKFICEVARAPDEVLARRRIPTTSPRETLEGAGRFFLESVSALGPLKAMGVAGFGPLDLAPTSPGYGSLLATPKAGWSGASLLKPLQDALGVPVNIDTDVNAAAMAEARLGSGQGYRSVAYVTVGTGIGVGFHIDGRSLHGAMHPEAGHLLVRRDVRDMEFAGCCPFHGDCVEGLASGPAILQRWGRNLSECSDDGIPMQIIGGYLGQLAASIALTVSSEIIVFGGGVMALADLRGMIERSSAQQLNGYLPKPARIAGPGLGDRSGIVGALLLAIDIAARSS